MNYFDVKGRTLDLGRTDPRKQARLERFLSTYLHGNTTWVHVRGSRVGPDDDGEIEENGIDKRRMAPLPAWLLDALTQMTLKVPFPGTRQHDLIKSLTMNNIQMEFSMPTMTPLVSGDAIAMLQLPPEMRIAVDVLTISPDVFLYLDEDSLAPFARLKPPRPCRAHTTRDSDAPDGMFKVAAKIVKAPFKVLSEADFEKFLDRVMNKKDAVVYLEGTADAVIDSDLGAALTVRDLPFKGQIHTKGMDGMQHPGPKVTSLELVKGYQDALRVQTNLVLFNPSDISMHLGKVTFQLLYQEYAIGNATLDALSLAPGDNAFVAEGHLFHQDDAPTLLDFISSFLTGDNANLTISGANGTDSPYLLPLLNQLSFLVPIPPLDKPPLLQKVQMNLLSSTTIAWLENPFGAIDLSILVINATANYRDKHIGTMFANFSDGGRGWEGPVVIPGSDNSVGDDDGGTPLPALSVATPRIPVMLAATPDLEAIAKALGGKLDIDVNSFVHIQVDQFALNNLRYDRKNITAIVRKAF
ncbi:hypothetical protein BC940DRAFT_242428 [Gongronella butleri]|nr:hypothetical protein BC940DRAFT_242428 [Gongronella butleri]